MRKAAALSLVLVILSIAFLGCNFNKKSESEGSLEKKLKLPENIVCIISGEDVTYYEIEGENLKKLDLNIKGHIEVFSKELGLVIYRNITDEGTDLIITNGESEKKISVKGNIEYLRVSPGGTKLIYKYNSGDKIGYRVLDLQSFKEFDLNENLAISGENVEFLDENQLVLYGVDLRNKQTGIFIYNIKEGKYTLKKPIVKAFIDHIDLISNQVILYTQSSFSGDKECYMYNLSNNESVLLSKDGLEIETSKKDGDKIYFIGNKDESARSLYSLDIKTKKIDRLVYDFPKYIGKEALLLVKNGNIYFSGFNEEESKSALYMYNTKGKSVRLIEGNKGQYMILK
ncbi:hypothetical protein [Clostridium sp.]|uniref:hypothetical protein n=1 Tax=Clostridium sp. TaxID=1506 RepID=UPI00263A2BB1|nr:hypothetical protein [Clostridium sp.]